MALHRMIEQAFMPKVSTPRPPPPLSPHRLATDECDRSCPGGGARSEGRTQRRMGHVCGWVADRGGAGGLERWVVSSSRLAPALLAMGARWWQRIWQGFMYGLHPPGSMHVREILRCSRKCKLGGSESSGRSSAAACGASRRPPGASSATHRRVIIGSWAPPFSTLGIPGFLISSSTNMV